MNDFRILFTIEKNGNPHAQDILVHFISDGVPPDKIEAMRAGMESLVNQVFEVENAKAWNR